MTDSQLPKYLYFVYQFGKMDCVCHSLSTAREMACDPSTDRYRIERWAKSNHLLIKKGANHSYVFDKLIQKEKI